MQKPRAVLFDLDGTLIDNSEIVIDAYYTGMEKLGYTPKNREFIRTILGKSTYATGRELGLQEKDLPKIDAHFWSYFGNSAKNPKYYPKVYPGVKETLGLLQKYKIPTAIVTSNRSEFASILMKKVKLDRFITVFIGSEDVIEKKPSPEPLYVALNKIKVSKSDAKDLSIWYIGDTPTDIESATNAGVFSIGIPEKDKINVVKEKHPDLIFDSMLELYNHTLDIFTRLL